MRFNKSIRKIQQTHGVALLLLIVLQIISLFFVNLFLSIFMEGATRGISLQSMILAFAGCVFLICDLFFLVKKIIKLQPLIHKIPVKCQIEDFMLIAYTDEGRRKYRAYPIIRSTQDNKLYLSYGADALSNFNVNAHYINNTLVDFNVRTRSKTELKIGDAVNMYSLKTLDVSVAIDEIKNKIRLNGKKVPFYHVNDTLGIDIFENIVFFQGIIDVE